MLYSKRITLLAAAISSVSAYADVHQGDEMVVTANRVQQSIDSVLAPVTVINRAKIDAIQASDVYDILKRVPGVQLNRTGGRGNTTSVSVRGTNSGHVLILVDGVRIDSATLGTAALESISVEQIERIEIVRSPRSSLYGSDAIGGVVQIFTRNASKESETIVSVGYGTEDTRIVGTNSTFAYDSGSVLVVANYETSDGIDVQYADDEISGGASYDLDRDDTDSKDIALKWQQNIGEDISIVWSNFYNESEALYDNKWAPGSSPFTESINAKSSVKVDAALSDQWNLEVSLGYSVDDSRDRNEVASLDGDTQIKTKRHHHSINNSFAINDQHTVVGGVDYIQDFVSGNTDYAKDERENLGTFVQYLAKINDLSLSVGGRYDDNEQFGGQETGNVAVGYQFHSSLEVVLSHGTAFKAPTFNSLYWPATAFSSGNPDLVPEESENTELQFRGSINDFSDYELNLFYNEIDNLIEWQPDPVTFFYSPQNVSKARIRGAEFVYNAALDFADVSFNATYTEPKDLAADEDLHRRSRWIGSFDVSKATKAGRLGLTIHGVSDKKGRDPLPGYGTVDIRIERNFTPLLTAKLKVENLLDKEFVQVKDYNDIGRFALLEFEYKLEH